MEEGTKTHQRASQLRFLLTVPDPYSLKYFVPHSGVGAAYEGLVQLVQDFVTGRRSSGVCYLYGPKGSGKTHLAEGVLLEARRELSRLAEPGGQEVVNPQLYLEDLAPSLSLSEEDIQLWLAHFTDCYERVRSRGGLLLVTGDKSPTQVENPHISSRLCAGEVFSLSYPREEELEPLIFSLLERRNLKLSKRSIDYLLRRAPRDPLSFYNIFARVDELSFRQGKPAGFGVVREAAKKIHS